MRLRPPSITSASLRLAFLYLLDMHHQPGEVNVIIEIVDRHSSFKSPLIPLGNLLISSMFLHPREVVYLDSLTNFREYSLKVMDLYLRLINSSTLASLISPGMNLSRKVALNSSQVTEICPKIGYLATSCTKSMQHP